MLGSDLWDHNLSDAKGHWFYHMLRHRLGDDGFFAILRSLQREYAGRALSLAELRLAVVVMTPDDPGLEQFMEQWLDRPGAPHLDVQWWTTDEGRGVKLAVTQLQDELYVLELEVELTLANGHRFRKRVPITREHHEFALSALARVVDLGLDPNHRLLFWRPEYGPPVLTDSGSQPAR